MDSGILNELAERLGNFREGARALVDCLQICDGTRRTDQCVIEAAKCTFSQIAGRSE